MTKYLTLDHELQSKGYLPLYKACQWLKQFHVKAFVSYPTALKLVNEGKLRSEKYGKVHRISKAELHRFVTHGNWEGNSDNSESLVINPEKNSNQGIFNLLKDQEMEDDDDDDEFGSF